MGFRRVMMIFGLLGLLWLCGPKIAGEHRRAERRGASRTDRRTMKPHGTTEGDSEHQCQATIRSGSRCLRPALENSRFCWQHR